MFVFGVQKRVPRARGKLSDRREKRVVEVKPLTEANCLLEVKTFYTSKSSVSISNPAMANGDKRMWIPPADRSTTAIEMTRRRSKGRLRSKVRRNV